MPKLSYAIIGTGAIGGYYGSRLQQAGCDVHFLLRSDYQQVCESGLRIDSVDGDFVLPQVKAYNQTAGMPPVDVVIVAIKTTNNHRLWQLLPPIKPGGAILSLQNGFGIESGIVKQLEEKEISVPHVLGGLCFICSNKVGAGHVRHLDYGRVLLGTHAQDNRPCKPISILQEITSDFERANLPVQTTDDLPMARWQKLVWNVLFNGLSVVLDATTEEMMADSDVRSLITTLMKEVVSAANAWGKAISPGLHRHLSEGIVQEMLSHTETMPPYRTSMKIDYDEGRAIELEAIVGNPLRTAQQLNIATPHINMLYQQLAFLTLKNRSS